MIILNDLEILINEMNILDKQANAGEIDVERWEVFIEYARSLGCGRIANVFEQNLKHYQQEWKENEMTETHKDLFTLIDVLIESAMDYGEAIARNEKGNSQYVFQSDRDQLMKAVNFAITENANLKTENERMKKLVNKIEARCNSVISEPSNRWKATFRDGLNAMAGSILKMVIEFKESEE